MPESVENLASEAATPDYIGLVQFLVKPFLETPDSLRVDCEVSPTKAKVWVRLAFEGSDKGRVFGRGGRNIQAIRTVLEAAARAVGFSAYLDVYGSQSQGRQDDSETVPERSSPPRRASGVPLPKPRSRSVSPPEETQPRETQ